MYTVTLDTGMGIGVKGMMRVPTLEEEKGLVGEGEEGQEIDLDDAEATIVHRMFTYTSHKSQFYIHKVRVKSALALTPWGLEYKPPVELERSESSGAGKANGRGTRALAVVRFKDKLRELGLAVFVFVLSRNTGRPSPTQRWCSSTMISQLAGL